MSSHLLPAGVPRRGHRMPWIVLLFGLTSIILLLAVDYLRHTALERDNAAVRAIGDFRTQVTVSHLWTEEFVSGDKVPEVDIEDNLFRAGETLRHLFQGVAPGSTEQARIARLTRELGQFRKLSAERRLGFVRGWPTGIGSRADVEFDASFHQLERDAEALRTYLEDQRLAHERESRSNFRWLVGLWTAIVFAASAGLFTRERRRWAAEVALLESQAQLLQAQKMDAVGRLASGLAHDINNYLAAIRGHCELARMTQPVGEKLDQRMSSAITVVDKASSLITRLLTLSHQATVVPRVIDLNRLIQQLEKVLSPATGDTIRVDKQLAPDLWPVEVDPGQLEQVLLNLVVNARDAMPGGGTLTLSTANVVLAAVPGPGVQEVVRLEVADTGTGIPPELLGRIFEPFLTTKAGTKNSGLGLAVVYGIVRQHGGTIHVESEPGQGTRFRIDLPRSTQPTSSDSDDRDAAASIQGAGERMLLVDDHEEFRESQADLLRALGYEVITASSAEEALALMAQGLEVDGVISDVAMPGMTGDELLRRLRGGRPELPSVLITANPAEVMARLSPFPGVPLFSKQDALELIVRALRERWDAAG